MYVIVNSELKEKKMKRD